MAEFVEVAVKATGKKQTVPAHWLTHPTLAEPFRRLASETKRAAKAEKAQEPVVTAEPETGSKGEPAKG